jgi:CRP-like cAMP-binding protein
MTSMNSTPTPEAAVVAAPDDAVATATREATQTGTERNLLLGALPEREYRHLAPLFEAFPLDFGRVLTRPGDIEHYLYFPTAGTISIVRPARGGRMVEVASVGNEGVSGIGAFLGDGRDMFESVVQVAGEAKRVNAAALRAAAQPGSALDELLRRYTVAFLAQSMQSVACNCLHSAEERFARWLLSAHDRAGRNEFRLTQDFLAAMLGVRRATVTEAATALRKAGVIHYLRGRVRILDRPALERASCECYALIRAAFARVGA